VRKRIDFLNRLFDLRKCREEILDFLKDEHIINDDIKQSILHEHHTQHASKILSLFEDLQKKEALQSVEFEWKILPVEFMQLTLISKNAKKDFTYSV
jgi:flagellar motor switch protein FliG